MTPSRPSRAHRFPRYAQIAATLALALALTGGSAFAASKITSKQIKDGTIKGRDVHASTLTGAKVADGSLTAADLAAGTLPTVPAGPAAYGRFHDAPVDITGGVTAVPVLTLSVPAGSYAVSAKSWLINNSAGPSATDDLQCTLTAGGDSDTIQASTTKADAGATAPNRVSVSLQLLHTFASPGSVVLACNGSGLPSQANQSKITAIRVGSITSSAG